MVNSRCLFAAANVVNVSHFLYISESKKHFATVDALKKYCLVVERLLALAVACTSDHC